MIQSRSTRNLFRLLAILLSANLYLLILFKNLPFPFSSPVTFLALFILAIIYHYRSILISRGLLLIYLFALLYVAGVTFLWYDREVGWGVPITLRWIFISELQHVFICVLVYTYFLKVEDYKGLGLLVLFTLLFSVITIITSIVGLSIYPMAARELAGRLTLTDQTRMINFYNSKGIASFGFFSGLAFLFPVLIFYIKKPWIDRTVKTLYISMMALFFFGIIRSGFATTLLFAAVFSIAAFMARKNLRRSLMMVFLVGIVLIFTPNKYFANAMFSAASLFPDTLIEERFYDAGQTILDPEIDREGSEHAGRRLARIPILLESFAENPFIGGGENLGHNYWFDRLSMFGLLGLFPWFLILRFQILQNLKIFSDDFRFYYILTILAFFAYGLLKNSGGPQMMFFVLVIAPGVYFLKYLKYFRAPDTRQPGS